MKFVPIYLLMAVLGVCFVFGCRKDMANAPTLQPLSGKAAAKDSTGHPRDSIRHDTIPHDSIPHGSIPRHDSIPHWPGDSIPRHDTVPHWPGDSTGHRN
ncbi:hypothetical protein [Chitinophaga vietnamensis]|uniref:hypothetical protein n=1 Tax=Chitinophaga vietnamensis TaxID=2593957 RepID=UPI0011777925|nr:hypothetical protein [Chitinophaga vietnamensis]